MTKIQLTLAGAGCGKTTFLMEQIEKKLSAGVDPRSMVFLSFTKAAVEEAKSRVANDMKRDPAEFPYFKTLHALAYHLLGIKQGEMMDRRHHWNFEKEMKRYGISVVTEVQEDITRQSEHFAAYQLAVNKNMTLEEIYYSGQYEVPLSEIQFVIRAYKKYKAVNKKIDFLDLLILLKEKLFSGEISLSGIKVAFLDEAQDFTPLQWEIFFKLFQGSAEEIYIVADDDQSIYGWCGVDVGKFLAVPHDEKTYLSQTHRVPENVIQFSRAILSRIGARFEKDFYTKKPGGKIEQIGSIEELDIRKGESWFFLVRNICFAETLRDDLIMKGIPFLYFGEPSIDKKHLKAIEIWEGYRKSRQLSGQNKNYLLDYTDISFLASDRPWYEILIHIDPDSVAYYRRCLQNGFSIKATPTVEVQTIHRVKGREADNVVVSFDQTERTARAAEEQPDDEHRVFYVAVTRTKKNLYILEPASPNYYMMGS